MEPRTGRALTTPASHPPGQKAPDSGWELLKAALDGHSSHIAVLDEAGTILLVNSAWRRFADANGMAWPHYGVGTNYLELCNHATGEWADEARAAAQAIRDVLSGARDQFDLEHPCDSPGGKRWFAMHVTGFTHATVRNAAIAHRDITERKRAEEVLRESQVRFRTAFEQGPVPMCLVGPEGHFLSVNAALCQMLQYSKEELLLKTFTDVTHPADVARSQEWVAALLAGTAKAPELEKRYLRKDGETVWGVVKASLLRDTAGAPSYFVTHIQDVTERKRAEQALHASEARYREMVENLNDVIYRADRDGVMTYISPAVQRMLGAAPEEIIGRTFTEFLHPEDLPAARESYQGVLADRLRPSEYRVLDGEGRLRWLRISSRPMIEGGEVVGVQGVLTDISEQKLAEEALRRSRQQLRALAARHNEVREEERKLIARELHDELGQGLTGLRFDAASVAARLPGAADEAERRRLAAKLQSVAEALSRAVRKVRAVTTLLRPAALDDLGLVAAAEWLVADFQERTGVRCGLAAAVGDAEITPDCTTALFRILQEALTNVARHAAASEVEVSLWAEDGALTLQVEDNGRGITREQAADPRSLGLLGMRERAIAANGSLDIAGRQGKGTRVAARVPLGHTTGKERQ